MTLPPQDPNADNGLAQAFAWLTEGRAVMLATVVQSWGSSPRPAGSHLIMAQDGAFCGSVSGGCVEGAVMAEGQDTLQDGRPRLCAYGVTDQQAWNVGLACGGALQVFIERLAENEILATLEAAIAERRPVARAVRLADGASSLIDADSCRGALALNSDELAQARALLSEDSNAQIATSEGPVFIRSYTPAPRLVIVGAVHVAQSLAPMAALAGFTVHVIDPRRAFATAKRLPQAQLHTDWPDEALAQLKPDARTAIVTLSHDPKIDDPALEAALESPAYYIGALGSRRTHAKRLERLAERGFAAASLARIRAPIGLDLGGRLPAEIAVAVLAEAIAARHGRDPRETGAP